MTKADYPIKGVYCLLLPNKEKINLIFLTFLLYSVYIAPVV